MRMTEILTAAALIDAVTASGVVMAKPESRTVLMRGMGV